MGYELDRLALQYGLGSPTNSGAQGTPEQQAAYKAEYNRRIREAPMYLQNQFNTSGGMAPQLPGFSPGPQPQPQVPEHTPPQVGGAPWRTVTYNGTPGAQYGPEPSLGTMPLQPQVPNGYAQIPVQPGVAPSGLDGMLRTYFGANPNPTNQQIQQLQQDTGATNRQIYGATGNYWGNTLGVPIVPAAGGGGTELPGDVGPKQPDTTTGGGGTVFDGGGTDTIGGGTVFDGGIGVDEITGVEVDTRPPVVDPEKKEEKADPVTEVIETPVVVPMPELPPVIFEDEDEETPPKKGVVTVGDLTPVFDEVTYEEDPGVIPGDYGPLPEKTGSVTVLPMEFPTTQEEPEKKGSVTVLPLDFEQEQEEEEAQPEKTGSVTVGELAPQTGPTRPVTVFPGPTFPDYTQEVAGSVTTGNLSDAVAQPPVYKQNAMENYDDWLYGNDMIDSQAARDKYNNEPGNAGQVPYLGDQEGDFPMPGDLLPWEQPLGDQEGDFPMPGDASPWTSGGGGSGGSTIVDEEDEDDDESEDERAGFARGGSVMAKGLNKMVRKYADGGYVDDEEMPGRGLDLSRVSPQQLAALQAQDPNAVQLGAARFAGQGAQPSGIPRELIEKYLPPAVDYSADIRAAREQTAAARQSFNAMLERMAQQPAEGPSKAEMYFKLAQAFGTPGRTGSFGEGLGNAAGVLAEHNAQKRAAQAQQQARAQQIALKQGELSMRDASENESNVRSTASEDMRTRREFGKELIKDYINSGKPQSEAGKVAMDAGMRPGTPQYVSFVQKYVADKAANGDLYKQAMLAVAQGGLQVRQAGEQRAAEATKKLTPAEMKLKEETENTLNTTNSAYGSLKQALELNPNTFDNSVIDRMQFELLSRAGSEDPKVIATRTQANLLTKQALDSLKSSFGSAPTEGERAILLSLQGLDARSKKEREGIIKGALDAAKARYKREKDRLQQINSGAYRSVQAAPAIEQE